MCPRFILMRRGTLVSMDIASFRSQRESELGGLTPDTSLIDAEILFPFGTINLAARHQTQQSSWQFRIFRDDFQSTNFSQNRPETSIRNHQLKSRRDCITISQKLLAIVSIYSCRSESGGLSKGLGPQDRSGLPEAPGQGVGMREAGPIQSQ